MTENYGDHMQPLGDGTAEMRCLGCGEHLIIGVGDQMLIKVGDGGVFEGVYCAACAKNQKVGPEDAHPARLKGIDQVKQPWWKQKKNRRKKKE